LAAIQGPEAAFQVLTSCREAYLVASCQETLASLAAFLVVEASSSPGLASADLTWWAVQLEVQLVQEVASGALVEHQEEDRGAPHLPEVEGPASREVLQEEALEAA